ncbi:MAG: histidine phosphatase family protein [Propionicimonas sp.]
MAGVPVTRRLFLMRHGQAGFAGSDRERPLTSHGRAQAAQIGALLANRGVEQILCSPAVRTGQTASGLRLAAPVKVVDSLYNCSAGRILTALAALPERIRTALVVGHYPGIPSLAHELADRRSDAAALRQLVGPFSPATLVELEFTGAWNELHAARLVAVHRPAD